MLYESNVHLYTIPTLEIPYRLNRVVHQLVDAIPYDGKLFLVLNSQEDEESLVIIQQVHGVLNRIMRLSPMNNYRLLRICIFRERGWCDSYYRISYAAGNFAGSILS